MVIANNYKRLADIKKEKYSLNVASACKIVVNPTTHKPKAENSLFTAVALLNEPLTSNNPEIFGPHLWFILHTMSINYPQNPTYEQKQMMRNLILSLPIMLPCLQCQKHCSEYIQTNINKIDYALSSNTELFKFFVDFHNNVNKRKNKPILSYEQAYKIYTAQFYNKFTY